MGYRFPVVAHGDADQFIGLPRLADDLLGDGDDLGIGDFAGETHRTGQIIEADAEPIQSSYCENRVESMDGIDASELDAYVDAFVADGLARITRRVSMELDDDGEAQAQFEWVQREPRPTVVSPRPCPDTHR